MARRLCNNSIWREERWFKQLDPYYKLAWNYVNALCDISGMWQIKTINLIDDLRLPSFDIHKFIEACNSDHDDFTGEQFSAKRLLLCAGKLWITPYMMEQYESQDSKAINPKNKYAQAAIELLAKHGALGTAIREKFITLTTPLANLLAIIGGDGSGIEYPSMGDRWWIDGVIVNSHQRVECILVETILLRDPGESKGVPGGKKGEKPDLRIVSSAASQVSSESENNPADPVVLPEVTFVELQAFMNLFLEDTKFHEPMLMTWKLDLTSVRAWLNEFNLHAHTEEKMRKDYADYRLHFSRWMRRQKLDGGPPKREESTSNGNGQSAIPKLISKEEIDLYRIPPKTFVNGD